MADTWAGSNGKGPKRAGSAKKNKLADSGGYYRFTTLDDDYSSGSEDVPMSPKEYVDQVLRETEIDTKPMTFAEIPEPDFAQFDFLQELGISGSNGTSGEPRFSREFEDEDFCLSEIDDYFNSSSPKKLESPLDNPDSGYIEFLSSPAESNSGLSGDASQERPSSDVIDENTSQSPVDDSETKSRSLPSVRFRKFRNEFSRLDEDNYIEDDIPVSAGSPEDRPGMNDLDLGLATNSWDQCEAPGAKQGHTLLPMDAGNETEDESMLSIDRNHHSLDVCDTNPIILDQTDLTQNWQKKRRKILLSVGIVACVFGVAALAAITYIVVRFLTALD